MTRTTGTIAIILLIVAANGRIASMQGEAAQTTSQSTQAGRLDPRIKPAVAERYKAIRNATKWENPYLMVGPDHIVVRAKGLAGLKIVVPDALEQTLLELPIAAWPYGKVVAVQENGDRTDKGDDKPIADNVAAARAVLKKLGVTFDKWPS
jgi:hypothetical protein